MKTLSVYWAPLLMLVLLGNFLSHYGSRWEFGRYGMPKILVSANGETYRDGAPVDPLTAALVSSQCQEEVVLVIGLLFGGCAGLSLFLAIQIDRKKQAIRFSTENWKRLEQEQRHGP